jgi:outer membrane assembly lipoprotein YfgL
VGSDGRFAAAVTRDNELLSWSDGREMFRLPLAAQVFTAPLVAGGRIFVLSGDRVVSAFDASTGRKLWTQTRSAEPLVLRQAGVLLPVGDTLLVGMAGRLLGLNPSNGSVRWDAPIATPRGANEIERLVDLVADVGRQGNEVCVRAFQAAVGCVDAARGKLLWTKPASGSVGLDSDEALVFGVESDGKVLAWRRTDGERAWASDQLKFRGLTAPLVLGRSIVIGDAAGYVHFLSRDDGRLLARVATDGTGIAATPVVAANTLVVVTRQGGIFGFRPQ